MNKILISIISFIIFSFLLINTVNKKQTQKINKIYSQNEKSVSKLYEIKALKIPKNLNFSNEPVPINENDIKERMDRELLVNTYWQSNILLLIKRSNKFFPIIEPILKKSGLPDDFKYLCVAESSLINIPSNKGAAGFWHFMPQTGREYNLEINKNVDERYNIEKSTKVAAEYLKKAKKN